MSEQIARDVGPSHLDIAYECFGAPQAPPVVLIMGMGTQMLGWDDGFCAALSARGLRVIRFDNRDVGHSTHCSDRPAPKLSQGLAGNFATAAYRLEDMAADTVGLLDALHLSSSHLVGASMGGQIAQIMASDYPIRVRSLVSMMSSPGGFRSGMPTLKAMRLLALPLPTTRVEFMAHTAKVFRVIGSPAWPHDEQELRERAGRCFDRGFDVAGVKRQVMAMLASGDRSARLGSVQAPTLVIHGACDQMCQMSGGRATAAAIPDARLVVIEGMGHNLPPGLWARLANLIADHVRRAESAGWDGAA